MNTVYLKLDFIETDPIQYKPYRPRLSGESLYIAVKLPDDSFDDLSWGTARVPDGMILTPAGLAELMGKIAMAIRSRLIGR